MSERQLSGWGLEHVEPFLANPVPGDLQGVEADLGRVLVVASVKDASRASSEGSGGEDHDPEVDGLAYANVFDLHQLA